MPCRLMSSTKTPCPCRSRRSSLRGTFWPDQVFSVSGASTCVGASVVVVLIFRSGAAQVGASALRRAPSSLRSLRGRLDGLEDVPVARAAADVALQRLLDLVVGRARVVAQERGRAHQHPRRAVAALKRVVILER